MMKKREKTGKRREIFMDYKKKESRKETVNLA